VQDAEQRRHGPVDAAVGGFERGAPGLVDRDAQPREPGHPADDVDRRPARPALLVRDHQLPQRLAELAQTLRVGRRDPVPGRHEALLPQPGRGLLRGPDAVPVVREVVVVGVDEALQQLEPPGRLRPVARLEVLADPALVPLVHQTSIMIMLV
jgi:hypothetical protein